MVAFSQSARVTANESHSYELRSTSDPPLHFDVARKLKNEDVLERLSDLFICRGVPKYLRSDNGPEFTTNKVRDWLKHVEVQTLFVEPGSPWENGYIESFNGKLCDELLICELFDTMLEAKVLIRILLNNRG